MICDSNIETNFPHKLLVADTQILRLCEASVNSSSAIIKLSKIQLSKMVQLGRFLGELVGSLAEFVFRVGIDLLILSNKYQNL